MHISFSCMFISVLYMLRAAMCPSSGKLIVSVRHLVYVTLYRWPFGVHINPLNTELNPICHLLALLEAHHILHISRIRVKGHIQNDIYQMSYWYNLLSWWWAHGCPNHVENRNKHTWKRIVHQVGYLKRLYRDARSTEHKILLRKVRVNISTVQECLTR